MRSMTWLLFVAAGVLAPGPSLLVARADAPPPADRAYAVEAVMVTTATAERVEQPPAWGGAPGSPYTSLAWPARLALLKERGTTRVLVDGVTTGLDGMSAEIALSRARVVEAFDRKDLHNEFWKATSVHEGVVVKLVHEQEVLHYEAQVDWTLPAEDPGIPAVQESWRVAGTVRESVGRALVLAHREQITKDSGEVVGVELYVFVTSRPLGE